MASGASRLFHTIVVLGASIGCSASTAVGSQGSAVDVSAADESTSPIDSKASPGANRPSWAF
jgi:hypothetical protein